MLIASDDGGSVSLVDLATGNRSAARSRSATTIAASLALSPDGRLLAAASYDGRVHVWDTKTGEPYGAPLTCGHERRSTRSRSARTAGHS